MVEIIINKILYSVLLIALIYKVPVYKYNCRLVWKMFKKTLLCEESISLNLQKFLISFKDIEVYFFVNSPQMLYSFADDLDYMHIHPGQRPVPANHRSCKGPMLCPCTLFINSFLP